MIRTFRIHEVTDQHATRVWEVTFGPEIARLFGQACYSLLDWELRLSLAPLGKWLHAFYSTHNAPFSYSVQKLHALTWSTAKEMFNFRSELRKQLKILVEKGFLASAEISQKDLVVIQRA